MSRFFEARFFEARVRAEFGDWTFGAHQAAARAAAAEELVALRRQYRELSDQDLLELAGTWRSDSASGPYFVFAAAEDGADGAASVAVGATFVRTLLRELGDEAAAALAGLLDRWTEQRRHAAGSGQRPLPARPPRVALLLPRDPRQWSPNCWDGLSRLDLEAPAYDGTVLRWDAESGAWSARRLDYPGPMTGPDTDLAARFPRLHRREKWKWAAAHVAFAAALPDDALVTNVHVVGFVGDRIVVCREAGSAWFLPGGTRERGESVEQCAARELLEEAGARLLSPLRLIGAHYCASYRAEPIRPGDPHPLRAILWGTADVVVDASPTNPADAEQVTEVRTVPIPEARRLLLTDRKAKWAAELVTLAAEAHRPSAGSSA